MESKIIDGKPWTMDDRALFTDLNSSQQKQVLDWIKEYIQPRKCPSYRYSSYSYKHRLEKTTGIYITNNQFKHAMLISGYKPCNEHKLNWHFCVSEKSKCFFAKSC